MVTLEIGPDTVTLSHHDQKTILESECCECPTIASNLGILTNLSILN